MDEELKIEDARAFNRGKFQLLERALKNRELNLSDLRLLMLIVTKTWPDCGYYSRKNHLIAKTLGLSVQSVRAARANLESHGLITTDRQSGRSQANRYYPVLSAMDEGESTVSPSPIENTTPVDHTLRVQSRCSDERVQS